MKSLTRIVRRIIIDEESNETRTTDGLETLLSITSTRIVDELRASRANKKVTFLMDQGLSIKAILADVLPPGVELTCGHYVSDIGDELHRMDSKHGGCISRLDDLVDSVMARIIQKASNGWDMRYTGFLNALTAIGLSYDEISEGLDAIDAGDDVFMDNRLTNHIDINDRVIITCLNVLQSMASASGFLEYIGLRDTEGNKHNLNRLLSDMVTEGKISPLQYCIRNTPTTFYGLH